MKKMSRRDASATSRPQAGAVADLKNFRQEVFTAYGWAWPQTIHLFCCATRALQEIYALDWQTQ